MKDNSLETIALQAVKDQVTPGLAVGYSDVGTTWTKTFGTLTYAKDSPAVTDATIYDAASLTKTFTNTLIIMLLDSGKLLLEDKLADYVPELVHPEITIRHLLTYTVTPNLGMSPAKMTQEQLVDIFALINRSPLFNPPGTKFIYSNIDSMWLGLVIEKLYGDRLDRVMERELFKPLGMNNTSFAPTGVIAPTEVDNRGEVCGQPHDETAWGLERAGIYAGHAGVFTTVHDLLCFAQLYLREGMVGERRLMSAEIVRLAYENHQYPDVSPPNGLGWWLEMNVYLEQPVGHRTFGMTGFTGGMILIDPEAKRSLVMLSNRTYPKRPVDSKAINALRSEIARATFIR